MLLFNVLRMRLYCQELCVWQYNYPIYKIKQS